MGEKQRDSERQRQRADLRRSARLRWLEGGFSHRFPSAISPLLGIIRRECVSERERVSRERWNEFYVRPRLHRVCLLHPPFSLSLLLLLLSQGEGGLPKRVTETEPEAAGL